ncbi:rhamnan synthesis F family protein [Streptococcus hyovaginalis]|uniref:rhamnan synthesis F family protein n=1 Tax=Streptococcus hyovaginalis TaxID=149015 RepID=UPI0014791101|nr:rhamnan synthesis F family protein [Streptococcus hyovaginalis]
MKRLLLYVHFNKFDSLSSHVLYQLEQMRPLFSNVLFISNSQLNSQTIDELKHNKLIDDFIQRENSGFDFAAWRDGMLEIGFDELTSYDSVTVMNDTCFGPLWDLKDYYLNFESDHSVDFWGMTNNRETKKSRHSQGFREHLQSYYMVFHKPVLLSSAFQDFWRNIKSYQDVQDVINHYETQVTTNLVDAGFNYKAIFDTTGEEASHLLHADFSYYHPTAILQKRVPFLKVKAVDANQHITPYLLNEIEKTSKYPVDLIINHMSKINYPDFKYLLGRKYLKDISSVPITKKVAVHLHVFYVDLLEEFLDAFRHFDFSFDLYITTDIEDKVSKIEDILNLFNQEAKIYVTGNIGRDVLPMLKLKSELSQYDYIGHFHTKKSKEADFWAGESWRRELIDMLVLPANQILSHLEKETDLGLVIADIPTFFRYNRIVNAYNENQIAPEMNDLWEKMELQKSIDFNAFHTFVMSYGTFVWFKYDALKPLFDLDLSDEDVPEEPLPQNSILHAIERLLVYIAWDRNYDFRISKTTTELTPFIDNKLLNERGDLLPHTYVDFNHLGGIKGAAKYIFVGPARAIKYILKRLKEKI